MQRNIDKNKLVELVGAELGESDWVLIDQQRINRFAEDTLDNQYIHVDPERANKTPLGTTIAHGMLVLSLVPHFIEQCGINIDGSQMVMNYGFNSVRFLCPVPVDSQIRGNLMLTAAHEKNPRQYLVQYGISVEIKGVEKPALFADVLTLVFT